MPYVKTIFIKAPEKYDPSIFRVEYTLLPCRCRQEGPPKE
jgi:hypothetical protein